MADRASTGGDLMDFAGSAEDAFSLQRGQDRFGSKADATTPA